MNVFNVFLPAVAFPLTDFGGVVVRYDSHALTWALGIGWARAAFLGVGLVVGWLVGWLVG